MSTACVRQSGSRDSIWREVPSRFVKPRRPFRGGGSSVSADLRSGAEAVIPILFRKFQAEEMPAAGEIWIQPATAEEQSRRAVAQLVVERHLDGLLKGPLPWQQIVVDAEGDHPTFD